jgi:hypothetical protein
MTTATDDKLATQAELTAISDPRERIRQASATLQAALARAEPHRAPRNAAALQLAHCGDPTQGNAPVKAVALWRDAMQMSRSRWTWMLQEADLTDSTMIGTFDDPWAVLREHAPIVTECDRVAEYAREIRNATIRAFLTGEYGQPIPTNAELGEIAGVVPSRIAQLRGDRKKLLHS